MICFSNCSQSVKTKVVESYAHGFLQRKIHNRPFTIQPVGALRKAHLSIIGTAILLLATSLSSPGQVNVAGNAVNFDGAGGFIQVGLPDLAPPWTASMWVNSQIF